MILIQLFGIVIVASILLALGYAWWDKREHLKHLKERNENYQSKYE